MALDTMRPGEKGKLTVVNFYGTAVYLGDRLLCRIGIGEYGRPNGSLLRLLGYEVEYIDVDWEKMPCKTTGASKSPYAPESLSELKAHLDAIRRRERLLDLESARATVARLEAEILAEEAQP